MGTTDPIPTRNSAGGMDVEETMQDDERIMTKEDEFMNPDEDDPEVDGDEEASR